MTKVSVVMPIYNVEDYLKDSLYGLLNQSLEDIEIICVNDGSTDNSLEILNDFAQNDSRVKVIDQENTGAGIARNNGMKMAQGEYIHFIDADDIVTTDMLEKLYNNAISNDSDLVVFKVARFNDRTVNYKHPIFNLEKVFPNVDFNNFSFSHSDIKMNVLNYSFAPWTKFYKREFLEKNNLEFPDISSYNDVLIHVKSMLKASKISFVPEFLYFYRLDNANSITNDPTKHFNIFNVISSVEDFLIEEGFMDEYKNEFDLFKINQISRHMVPPVTEEYFKVAKNEFLSIDVSNNPLIKKTDLEKYEVALSLSADERDKFEDYLNLVHLQNKNEKLEKSIKKLNERYVEQQDIQKNILSSYSWKITKPLRSIKNHSLKESLLSKSNSYVFYKGNYSKLKKSNKTLRKKNERLEKNYEKIFNDKNQLSSKKDALIEEKSQLIKEKKQLINEKKQLIKENECLIEEKDELTHEKDDLNEILDSILNYLDNKNSSVPKVSVVIPVYNVEKYLAECLDSVVNQTLTDIEIICVNDGSTDNSLAILNEYAKSDERINVFSKENGGQGSARNLGMKNSVGEFIYFLDSDDYMSSEMLEELYHNAIFNNSDMVLSKIARFNNNSFEIDFNRPGFDFEKVFADVNFNNFSFIYKDAKKYVLNSSFAPWMKLFKRDFIVRNDFKFVENLAFEDVLFHVQTFLKARSISFSPNYFYYYRNNPNSTMNTSENGFDIFEVIKIVKEYLENENYYYEFKNEFELFKIIQILNYIVSTDSEDYFQLAKEEFSKIKDVSKLKISDKNLEKFVLVLNSDSLEDYKMHLED